MSATRGSWVWHPMPDARSELAWTRTFTDDELARVKAGRVPGCLTHRWFAFFEDGWLSLHRADTGVCVYRVRIDEHGVVREAWINGAPKQRRSVCDTYDAEVLAWVVDTELLGVKRPRPIPPLGG